MEWLEKKSREKISVPIFYYRRDWETWNSSTHAVPPRKQPSRPSKNLMEISFFVEKKVICDCVSFLFFFWQKIKSVLILNNKLTVLFSLHFFQIVALCWQKSAVRFSEFSFYFRKKKTFIDRVEIFSFDKFRLSVSSAVVNDDRTTLFNTQSQVIELECFLYNRK